MIKARRHLNPVLGNPTPRWQKCLQVGQCNHLQNPGLVAVLAESFLGWKENVLQPHHRQCSRLTRVRCRFRISKATNVKAIEPNISCPNVDHGTMDFLIGQDPDLAYEAVKAAVVASDASLC